MLAAQTSLRLRPLFDVAHQNVLGIGGFGRSVLGFFIFRLLEHLIELLDEECFGLFNDRLHIAIFLCGIFSFVLNQVTEKLIKIIVTYDLFHLFFELHQRARIAQV